MENQKLKTQIQKKFKQLSKEKCLKDFEDNFKDKIVNDYDLWTKLDWLANWVKLKTKLGNLQFANTNIYGWDKSIVLLIKKEEESILFLDIDLSYVYCKSCYDWETETTSFKEFINDFFYEMNSSDLLSNEDFDWELEFEFMTLKKVEI